MRTRATDCRCGSPRASCRATCACSAKRHTRCSWCRQYAQPTCAPTRQRARRRDRVKLGAECVRAQPAAAADARAPMPLDMQRWGFPPTTVSYCELQTLRHNSALAPSAERPGRHGGSLAAADELWPALLTKVVKLRLVCSARRRTAATKCDTLDSERRLPNARPMTVAHPVQSTAVQVQ